MASLKELGLLRWARELVELYDGLLSLRWPPKIGLGRIIQSLKIAVFCAALLVPPKMGLGYKSDTWDNKKERGAVESSRYSRTFS